MDKRIEELYQRYLSGELTPSELDDTDDLRIAAKGLTEHP